MVKSLCIQRFREALGLRVPDNQMLIDVLSEEAEVRSYPPNPVHAPAVVSSISG